MQLYKDVCKVVAFAEGNKDLKTQLDPQQWIRPESWGGYRLKPTLFEFLSLKVRGNEARTLWTKENDKWVKKFLAP